MTPIEKAAQEAAEETMGVYAYDLETIRDKFAPLQAELDAKDKRITELMEAGVAKDFEILYKDKLLREAMELVNNYNLLGNHFVNKAGVCYEDCMRCQMNNWLARVKE